MGTDNKLNEDVNAENLLSSTDELVTKNIPPGVDRRTFIMRSPVTV